MHHTKGKPHMKGKPSNMQDNPKYGNVIQEIITFFSQKIQELKLLGVPDVIIDPGFGFGKTLDHNYEILHHRNRISLEASSIEK